MDSESDNDEVEREVKLENYWTQTNLNVSSQSMVHTKQMARKSDSKVTYPISPVVVICWLPSRIDGRLDFWNQTRTLNEQQICFGLVPEDHHHVGPWHRVHQPETQSIQPHPQALILLQANPHV